MASFSLGQAWRKLQPRGPRVPFVLLASAVGGRLTVAGVDRLPLTGAGDPNYGYADFAAWLGANLAIGIPCLIVLTLIYKGVYSLGSNLRSRASGRTMTSVDRGATGRSDE